MLPRNANKWVPTHAISQFRNVNKKDTQLQKEVKKSLPNTF